MVICYSLVSNNKPMKNAKNTSYGHLVEMGEILSVVEFVESQNF